MKTDRQKSKALVSFEIPGSRPLRNTNHERFCRLRAVLRPKADAYRQAGWNIANDIVASSAASRLERRQDVADRIAFLSRQDEEILRAKRARIEEFLWVVHESNTADLWETVEVERTDKDGKPILDENGIPLKKTIQRAKMLSELPPDVQRIVETCEIDKQGRVVPKPYSKMTANQELRKLLNIGVVSREDGEFGRMSDAELIAELSRQAKELGVEIDLSYRIAGEKR